MPHSALRLGAGLLTAVIVCGCSLGGLGGQKAAIPPEVERVPPNTGPIGPVLEMMSNLPQRDPASQAETFQSVKDAAELTPTTSNRLRYALALATPGHAGADPVAAQRQLSQLLARPETLLPAERWLALIELRDVEQQLILQAETKRLREDAARDSHGDGDKLAASNRRLAAEIDENARLRKALDEARAKLEAVTHVERTINDRASNTPTNP